MKIRAVIGIILSGVLMMMLVSCGKSDEEVIREGITQEFESIKNFDEKASTEIGDPNTFFAALDLGVYGIEDIEFYKIRFSGFDYSIDSIKVEGDQATVTVTVTCKSLKETLESWRTQVDALKTDSSLTDITMSDLNIKRGSLLMDCMRSAPMCTATIDLPYVRNGNVWEEGPNFDTACSPAFSG